MKKSILVCVVCTMLSGCALLKDPNVQKQAATDVIGLELAMCLAKNPDASEPLLQDICHISNEVLPIVREFLGAQKLGIAKLKSACK